MKVKHIVSLSGGVGSYFTLKRVIEKNGKQDVDTMLNAIKSLA